MPGSRTIPAALLLGLVAALAAPAVCAQALAAEPVHRVCLTKAEQRAAIVAHKAIPLGQAIKSLHEHGAKAEVLRARLCHHGDGLAYVLTLLARSGKVTSATVDAANGEIATGR
jgi:uncharacterized membrane protein YkoI